MASVAELQKQLKRITEERDQLRQVIATQGIILRSVPHLLA